MRAEKTKMSDRRSQDRPDSRKIKDSATSGMDSLIARAGGANVSEQSGTGPYYALQRPNHVPIVPGPDPFPSSNPISSLGLQLSSSLYPQNVWNPTFPSEMGRNSDSILSSLPSTPIGNDVLGAGRSDANSNQGRNPQFASLIHTQNVLCRQLEQLTDHNINLATRNSALRAELEQAKEENLHMIQVRQMQAQQALKQAHDYEDLLLKFEKSGETIRSLRVNKKNAEKGKHSAVEEENSEVIDEVKLTVLRRDNSVLRLRIQELQGKNTILEGRVEELTTIIDGAGVLLHDSNKKRKLDVPQGFDLVSLPTTMLRRHGTKEAALPTTANRQVTNDMTLPTFLKRDGTIELANPTVNNRQVTNEAALLSNLKSTKSENAQKYYQAKMDKTFSNLTQESTLTNLKNDNLDGDLRDEDESSDDERDKNEEQKKKVYSSAITKLLHASRSINEKSSKYKKNKSEPRIPIERLVAALSKPEPVKKRKRGRPKRDKSEGWPKRPLSAYNLFFREQRIKILDSLASDSENIDDKEDHEDGKDDNSVEDGDDKSRKKRGRPIGSGKKRRRATPHGIITFENLGKKISQDWKEAPEDQKVKYKEQATLNLQRYHEELEAFQKKRQIKIEETIARETLARRQQEVETIDLLADEINEKYEDA